MPYDELEDLEACVREGREPRQRGPYAVKIALPGSEEFQRFRIDDPLPDGRGLIRATGLAPVAEHLIFMVLRGGGFEELRLDETVDLRTRGIEKFIIFESSASYRFVIEGERYEWGTDRVTAGKIAEIGRIDLSEYELWQERRDGEDDVRLDPTDIINLSDPGLERFYKRKQPPEQLTIFINGRRKKIGPDGICFEDLIALAFEHPPQGEQICFTVTFRKGPADRPEGSLLEGQCIDVVKGMVFNVTATDKS